MIVGSVFIREDCDTLILIEQVDDDRVVFQYIVCDEVRFLGKRNRTFVVCLLDNNIWVRVV